MASKHRVVLIRHGETEWSRIGRHTSVTDLPLLPVGQAQAKALQGPLAQLQLHDPLVYSSPRKRALQTAELAGLAVNETWNDLAEWNYGEYEGFTTQQIQMMEPNWSVWTHPSPDGESEEEVLHRADRVIREAVSRLAYHDVVLVGHGHFSRALVVRWLEQPLILGRRFAFPAASMTVLGHEHDIRVVEGLGIRNAPTGYLDGAGLPVAPLA
ncbi:MAG: acid phosphatase [Segniliparus sp.]|uniref:acid phosphatase n=1 Tax=Segniliparus sp. TaxID=2804064 RepID=UPI003F2EE74E